MQSDDLGLARPRGHFQELVRELAIAAQETLYHDIDRSMPEFSNGVSYLEPIFSRILRGKVKQPNKPRARQALKDAP